MALGGKGRHDRDTDGCGAIESAEGSAGDAGGDRPPSAAELDAARELVRLARDRGVALTGPDGLLKALTKTVIETALDEEMSEHLGL